MPVPGIAVVCTARNAALTALRSSSATAQPSSVMLSRITRPHFWTSLLTKRRHRSGPPPPHHVHTRYRDALANLGAYQVLRHGFAHLAHVLVRRAGAPEQRQPAQCLELGEALLREAPDAGQHGGSPSARRPPALMCLLTLTTLATSSATCPASTSCRAGPAQREGACVSLKSPTRCMSALERWGRLPMPEVAVRRTLRPRRQILDTAPGRVLVRHQGQGRRHDQAGRREGLHHALGQAHHRLVGGLLLLGEQPRVTVRLGASRSVVPIEPEARRDCR